MSVTLVVLVLPLTLTTWEETTHLCREFKFDIKWPGSFLPAPVPVSLARPVICYPLPRLPPPCEGAERSQSAWASRMREWARSMQILSRTPSLPVSTAL